MPSQGPEDLQTVREKNRRLAREYFRYAFEAGGEGAGPTAPGSSEDREVVRQKNRRLAREYFRYALEAGKKDS